MRSIAGGLNNKTCIENVSRILGLSGEEELEELPHWDTINEYLKKLEPTEIERIIPKLVYRLTRMRTFENSKIRKKYWQVVVDGTHLYTFKERHCEHCCVREFRDKSGEITRTEYYHAVLEAKLLLLESIVISIATEFIENEKVEVTKQDCELNAFYRMAEKFKRQFPRLPICLTMDSLYACGPVFKLCKRYGWHYIIRFKDGSMKTVSEDFHALKDIEPKQSWTKINQESKKTTQTYKYVLKISYQSYELNAVEFTQSDLPHPFVFITDLSISRRNCEKLVEYGRLRWKIENEGFNIQKNHGLGICHLFCKNYTAIKNHYFLIQISHMIVQLLEIGLKSLTALSKMATKQIVEALRESFRVEPLTEEDEAIVNRRFQYRFRC